MDRIRIVGGHKLTGTIPISGAKNAALPLMAAGTYADIVDISRRPAEFSSGQGTQIFDQTPEMREYRGSIIDMDDPEHMRIRKIVSRGFTPRMLSELRGLVEETTAEILDEMPESGDCDFVSHFAILLPLRIIDNILGVPREHEQFILQSTNVILGASDPEYVPDLRAPEPNLDPIGRIAVLEDTNNDGKMDKRTVFADGLVQARAVKALDHGILVLEPPNVWLMHDTNGDLTMDTKELVGTDYGRREGGVEGLEEYLETKFVNFGGFA